MLNHQNELSMSLKRIILILEAVFFAQGYLETSKLFANKLMGASPYSFHSHFQVLCVALYFCDLAVRNGGQGTEHHVHPKGWKG